MALCSCLPACAHRSGPDAVATDAPLPSAEEAVRAHNARVARLDRLWARAVVTIRFTDPDGDEKWEQGNGFFQLRDANKLALSIGKVGEMLVWIGANERRYWVLDRLDDPVAYVGAHDEVTRERLARAGLPVPPRELLRLGALRPIDAARARTERDAAGRTRVVVPDGAGAWRYNFEPAPVDDLPVFVDRLDGAGELVLRATIESPETVRVGDGLGFPPRTWSRLVVEHVPTGDSIIVRLDGEIEDGRRRGVPNESVFDLDVLLNAYGPFERVIDLDEEVAPGAE